MMFRTTTSLLLSTLAATAFAGCELKGDLGEYTDTDTGESETGTSTDATTSTSESETGASGTTTGTSDATGETGSTGSTDDTGETGTPACEAPELDLQANFQITLEPPLPEAGGMVAADCTVGPTMTGGNFGTVVLDCGDRKATLDINTFDTFNPVFEPGDTLAFRYQLNQYGEGSEEWFTLRTPSPGLTLLLGGLNAFSLQPSTDDDSTFFEPVVMKAVSGVCALPSGCNDPFERLALDVSYDGATRQIVDGTTGIVGQLTSMRIDLGTAQRFHDDDCNLADVPGEMFEALLVMLPEG